MNAIKLLTITLLIIACNSSNEPAPETKSTEFTVMINGELFTPDRSGSGAFYKGELSFGAVDTIDRVNNEEKFWIFFNILNPQLGVNSIGNSIKTSNIRLHRWLGPLGSSFPATSGEFILTEFDTVNRIFSGTFNCTFDYPDNSIFYELKNGQFNGFSLSELFCGPELPLVQADSTSLFNKWGLIGFKLPDGSYSYPPCETESNINITPHISGNSVAHLSGKAPVNYFGLKSEIVDSTFITGPITATRTGGPDWELDYERDLINFLDNDTISFILQNEELIFSNTTWDSKLVFKTIE